MTRWGAVIVRECTRQGDGGVDVACRGSIGTVVKAAEVARFGGAGRGRRSTAMDGVAVVS
jgi:hypothetical protein